MILFNSKKWNTNNKANTFYTIYHKRYLYSDRLNYIIKPSSKHFMYNYLNSENI